MDRIRLVALRWRDVPIAELRAAMAGLPFADDAVAMVERAYAPGATMGSAFAGMVKELFGAYGLLLIDPMERAIRELAAPLMKQAVERMPELIDALMARSRNLVERGYHAQVLVDKTTSLAFLLDEGRRIALRQTKIFRRRTWQRARRIFRRMRCSVRWCRII